MKKWQSHTTYEPENAGINENEAIQFSRPGNYYLDEDTRSYRMIDSGFELDEQYQEENFTLPYHSEEAHRTEQVLTQRLQYHQGIDRFLNRAILIVSVILVMILLVAFMV